MVIRITENQIFNTFGKNWKDDLGYFSRVMGFSVETGNDVKIELNPDRPDLYSIMALHRAYLKFIHKDFPIGKLKKSKRLLTLSSNQRKYAIAYEVHFSSKNQEIIQDSLAFTDKLSETTGRSRKMFAFGLHDIDHVHGNLDYGEGDTSFNFDTFDGVSGDIWELIQKHEKGIAYGRNLKNGKYPYFKDEQGAISIPPLFNSSRTRIRDQTESMLVDITAEDRRSLEIAARLSIGYFINLGADVSILETIGKYAIDTEELLKEKHITIDPSYIKKSLGLIPEEEKMDSLFERIGYEKYGSYVYTPFMGRVDIMGKADLMEDLVKAIELRNISEAPLYSKFTGKPDSFNALAEKLRSVMLSMGLQEVINFVLTSKSSADDGSIMIMNPKSEDYSAVRRSLFNGTMEFFKRNKHNGFPQKIFEIGDVIDQNVQKRLLSIGICSNSSSYSEIKGYLDALLSSAGIHNPVISSENLNGFINGRSGGIMINEKKSGFIGEVHPETIKAYELELPVVYMQIELQSLIRKL